MPRSDPHPGQIHVDQQAGDTVFAAGVGHADHDLGKIRCVGMGDETLGSGDDVMVAVAQNRTRSYPARVGASIRFGLGETGDLLSTQHRIPETPGKVSSEPQQDRSGSRTEDGVVARRHRHRAADLLPEHGHAAQVEPGAAQLLGHIKHPQSGGPRPVAESGNPVRRQETISVELRFERDQLAVDEPAQQVPKCLVVVLVQCQSRSSRLSARS
ncbi:MAG: hypothetical protein R3D62_11465 [Xanthobacteraceae bacterium]